MNVGLILITHGDIGAVLLQAAIEVLSICPLITNTISVPADCIPEQVFQKVRKAASKLDSGDGVLVLTDLYGATPSNIACRLNHHPGIRIVAGLNLPMLIRVLNYPRLSLDELALKAVSGGMDGVLICNPDNANHAE